MCRLYLASHGFFWILIFTGVSFEVSIKCYTSMVEVIILVWYDVDKRVIGWFVSITANAFSRIGNALSCRLYDTY